MRPSVHLHFCVRHGRGLGAHRTCLPNLRSLKLTINTGTMIVTFLMAFLTQNTQNRVSESVRNKLSIWRTLPRRS